ncbi:MAG: DUF4292 domain-containing protein [Paludibacteraceae bacterium]|nr:DUF4292 domain-containing protein [Paludibacteraceae bacterium]
MSILNTIKRVAPVLCAALLMASCSSKKVATTTETAKQERKIDDVSTFRTLSMDKATFTLVNAYGNQTSLNGSIRIARDSIIICSITPFVGVNMEFARIGIDKEGITILDRINKRYFKLSFEEAQARLGMAMNYNAFESIFTDRVFIYNKPYIPMVSDFKVTSLGDQVLLAYADNSVSQEFYFDASKNMVSGMIASGNRYSMRWNYSDFAVYNNVNFPKRFALKIAGPDFHRQINVQYKDVELDRDRSFEFKVPSSYKQVSLDELLKEL